MVKALSVVHEHDFNVTPAGDDNVQSFFSNNEEGKVLDEVYVNDSYVTPLCDDDADDVIQCL